jgi:hypothetical protein
MIWLKKKIFLRNNCDEMNQSVSSGFDSPFILLLIPFAFPGVICTESFQLDFKAAYYKVVVTPEMTLALLVL